MSDLILDGVTFEEEGEIMRQYELIRSGGGMNMYDWAGVINLAARLGLDELEQVSRDDYKVILGNFSELMSRHGIEQRLRGPYVEDITDD